MANWCTSRMQISGCSETIDSFSRELMSSGVLDLKKIIPNNNYYYEGCFAHFEVVHRSDRAIELLFQTKWAPPDDAFKQIAINYPELSIRVIAVVDGDEIAYQFTSHNADYKEEHLPFTEEFVEEVTGKAQIVDPSYFVAATLRKPKATHFMLWLAKKRIERALLDYPVYDPPHRGIEMAMSYEQSRENFDYFMSERFRRLNYLNKLLVHFGITIDYNDVTKQKLDKWIWQYGGFLYVDEWDSSFHTRNPKWEGKRVGFNVIFDLGVLLGEWTIIENPFLFWEMNTAVPTGARKSDEEFQKPVIGGLRAPPRWRLCPMEDVYRTCGTLWYFTQLWRNRNIVLPPKQQLQRYFTRQLRQMHFTALGDLDAAREESVWGPSHR